MPPNDTAQRVMIIAPLGQDAGAMAEILRAGGIRTEICVGARECVEKLSLGAGALLFTEEALQGPGVSHLMETLKAQPPWSELPLIILTQGGESRLAVLLDHLAEAARSITLLERPIGKATLVRSVQVALRSRQRQYEVRDLLAEQQQRRLELEAAQEHLRESEERFRLLAENIPHLAWMTDKTGSIFWYNRRWFEYTGTTLEEMRGWNWMKVHHPDEVERVVAGFQRALARGEPWEDTFPLRAKDGSYRWFLSRAFPLRDARGRIRNWFGTNTDITERKNFEAELERVVAERTADLQDANEQLEAFVYSVAHDLRAPLRSMNGYSQMLVSDHSEALNGTARMFLERILKSSEFMDRLLLDLLTFGQMARAELDLGPVDVGRAWEAAQYQCQAQIEQTGARIEVIGALPKVRAHESTLGQCLANLLSNSLKFVEDGVRPNVRVRVEDSGPVFRLWVEDNGIGIPPEHRDRVFRVFERMHGARFAGTGIGLSIVRKGIERMGGKVGIESEPGQGSRFWIEMKKLKVSPADSETPASTRMHASVR